MSHVEYAWADPRYATFLERLARFSRLIVFDKGGTGVSDRNTAAPILDERVADVPAVLDAAGSERTVLFSTSEAAALCALFAATYPERTAALALAHMKKSRNSSRVSCRGRRRRSASESSSGAFETLAGGGEAGSSRSSRS